MQATTDEIRQFNHRPQVRRLKEQFAIGKAQPLPGKDLGTDGIEAPILTGKIRTGCRESRHGYCLQSCRGRHTHTRAAIFTNF
jgi:hypothetical protein